MNEQEYMKRIERTMNNDLTDKEKLVMLVLGMAGEIGELVDNVKKHIFHGHPLDIDDTKKELGDVEWYRNHFMKLLDIDPSEVRALNIAKLEKRYKEGFSEEASLKRVDTTEGS
jgi:NTP pyrophosphatase (non-canonical NTP hydrolase)